MIFLLHLKYQLIPYFQIDPISARPLLIRCIKRIKKDPLTIKESFAGGGQWRIRTAVHGFADRCLATRPTDQSFIFIKLVGKDSKIIFQLARKNKDAF